MERRRVDMAASSLRLLLALDYENKIAKIGDTLTLLLYLLSNNTEHFDLLQMGSESPSHTLWDTRTARPTDSRVSFQPCRTQHMHS